MSIIPSNCQLENLQIINYKITIDSDLGMLTIFLYEGIVLSILALLPYMIQRFNEPDEFSLSCASIVGQVIV